MVTCAPFGIIDNRFGATAESLHWRGVLGSHNATTRKVTTSLPCRRSSTTTSWHVCSPGPLVKVSTNTFVPPGTWMAYASRTFQPSILSSYLADSLSSSHPCELNVLRRGFPPLNIAMTPPRVSSSANWRQHTTSVLMGCGSRSSSGARGQTVHKRFYIANIYLEEFR